MYHLIHCAGSVPLVILAVPSLLIARVVGARRTLP